MEFRVKDDPGADPILLVVAGSHNRGYRLPGFSPESAHPLQLFPSEQWLVVGYTVNEHNDRWHFIHRPSDKLCATLDWPLHHAQARCIGPDLLLFDHQGRLSHINVAHASQRSVSIN